MQYPQFRQESEAEKRNRLAREQQKLQQLQVTQTAAFNAYRPSTVPQQEIAAAAAADQAAAAQFGQEEAYKRRWRGSGLIGAPVAAIVNKFTQDKKADKYRASELSRLTKARELARMKAQRTGLDKARGQAFGDVHQTSERLEGQDYGTSERLGRQGYQTSEREEALKRRQVHDPAKPGRVLNVWEDGSGRTYTKDAQGNTTQIDGRNLRTVVESATGSAASQQKFDQQRRMDDLAADPFVNQFRRVFSAPKEVLQAATGQLDPQNYIAKFGLGGEDSQFYNDVQDVQGALGQLTFESAAPLLQKLGVNPSDTDVKVAFETAVSGKTNNIPALLGAYKRAVIPNMIGKARVLGVRSDKEISEIESELYRMIAEAEQRYGAQKTPALDMSPSQREKRLQELDEEIRRLGGS